MATKAELETHITELTARIYTLEQKIRDIRKEPATIQFGDSRRDRLTVYESIEGNDTKVITLEFGISVLIQPVAGNCIKIYKL